MNSALATTRGTPGSIARCQPRGGGRVYDSFFFFFFFYTHYLLSSLTNVIHNVQSVSLSSLSSVSSSSVSLSSIPSSVNWGRIRLPTSANPFRCTR